MIYYQHLLVMILYPLISGFMLYILLLHLFINPFMNFIKRIKLNRGEKWDETTFKIQITLIIIGFTLMTLINSLYDFFVYHHTIQ